MKTSFTLSKRYSYKDNKIINRYMGIGDEKT